MIIIIQFIHSESICLYHQFALMYHKLATNEISQQQNLQNIFVTESRNLCQSVLKLSLVRMCMFGIK